eukprot:365910-Chlamydomonas_euryale.AAC.22
MNVHPSAEPKLSMHSAFECPEAQNMCAKLLLSACVEHFNLWSRKGWLGQLPVAPKISGEVHI